VCIGLVVSPKACASLRSLCWEPCRRDYGSRTSSGSWKKNTVRPNGLGDGSRHDQRREHRAFARANAQYMSARQSAVAPVRSRVLEDKDWKQVREGVEVKLCRIPMGKAGNNLCCAVARRDGKKKKPCWPAGAAPVAEAFGNPPKLQKRPAPADRSSGAWADAGRYPARRLFEVEVQLNERQQACGLRVGLFGGPQPWPARRTERICCAPTAPKRSGQSVGNGICNCSRPRRVPLRQERLSLRPIFHHQDERVKRTSGLFLSLALWDLEMWMRARAGQCAGNWRRDRDIKSLDVVLPVKTAEG